MTMLPRYSAPLSLAFADYDGVFCLTLPRTPQAMLVAGFIGVLIQEHATFAAEVAGCMAECGAGSGMAAAAITTLGGGTVDQALGASSLALQSSFGMTCDPIANRVEAPCLGKNTIAATNALSCSNMALAKYVAITLRRTPKRYLLSSCLLHSNFQSHTCTPSPACSFKHLIPLDEVLIAFMEVGQALPDELCCTGRGGLAVTPSAREIEKRLGDKRYDWESGKSKKVAC